MTKKNDLFHPSIKYNNKKYIIKKLNIDIKGT